jgi:hypothetical protein
LKDLFPIPHPMSYDPGREYFYNEVVKPMIEPILWVCNNGQHIDLDRVEKLAKELDKVLDTNTSNLQSNELVKQFISHTNKKVLEEKELAIRAKLKDIELFIEKFDHKNMTHRSYYMNIIASSNTINYFPNSLLPNNELKWTVRDCQKVDLPTVKNLLKGEPDEDIANKAINKLAYDKAVRFNSKYLNKIKSLSEEDLPPFNPNSSKQIKELFKWLGIETIEVSAQTGEASWGRQVLAKLKEKLSST